MVDGVEQSRLSRLYDTLAPIGSIAVSIGSLLLTAIVFLLAVVAVSAIGVILVAIVAAVGALLGLAVAYALEALGYSVDTGLFVGIGALGAILLSAFGGGSDG